MRTTLRKELCSGAKLERREIGFGYGWLLAEYTARIRDSRACRIFVGVIFCMFFSPRSVEGNSRPGKCIAREQRGVILDGEGRLV